VLNTFSSSNAFTADNPEGPAPITATVLLFVFGDIGELFGVSQIKVLNQLATILVSGRSLF
jgi:hypothetical protein